jgi:hypothetical protein
MGEPTFHFSDCISCYNCRIWELQQPNIFFEYVRDTLKVNIWPGLLHDNVIGPFSWKESLLWTADIYLHLLEQFVFSQVDDIERENATGVVLQQDSTPSHFSLQVCLALCDGFPDQWIGSHSP